MYYPYIKYVLLAKLKLDEFKEAFWIKYSMQHCNSLSFSVYCSLTRCRQHLYYLAIINHSDIHNNTFLMLCSSLAVSKSALKHWNIKTGSTDGVLPGRGLWIWGQHISPFLVFLYSFWVVFPSRLDACPAVWKWRSRCYWQCTFLQQFFSEGFLVKIIFVLNMFPSRVLCSNKMVIVFSVSCQWFNDVVDWRTIQRTIQRSCFHSSFYIRHFTCLTHWKHCDLFLH